MSYKLQKPAAVNSLDFKLRETNRLTEAEPLFLASAANPR
jgi:hypothetical protein